MKNEENLLKNTTLFKLLINYEFEKVLDYFFVSDVNEKEINYLINYFFRVKNYVIIDWLSENINIKECNSELLSHSLKAQYLKNIDLLFEKDLDFSFSSIYSNIFYCHSLHYLLKNIINHHDFDMKEELEEDYNERSFISFCINTNTELTNDYALHFIENNPEYLEDNIDSLIVYFQNTALIKKIYKELNLTIDFSDNYHCLYDLISLNNSKSFEFIEFLLENTNVDPIVDHNEIMLILFDDKNIKLLNLFKNNIQVKKTLKKDHPHIYNFVYLEEKLDNF
jgi:hypothetical protein